MLEFAPSRKSGKSRGKSQISCLYTRFAFTDIADNRAWLQKSRLHRNDYAALGRSLVLANGLRFNCRNLDFEMCAMPARFPFGVVKGSSICHPALPVAISRASKSRGSGDSR